ncbi:MAG: YgeY family selenium metabolism-linked hydrolase [Lachnospiraceae bacterium]|jgi:putative selenium metabolism hydrolase|nr:YgeY family selenium metabolism-linked hydrolase [Lachnospiraceae bacterium]
MAIDFRQECLSLCKELILTPGVSGKEEGVAKVLIDFFRLYGASDVRTDRYGNVIATFNGSKPGKTILFDGHMDTVPVVNESEWENLPFCPTIKDGKLYGRGTSDMKCALAAMACAAVAHAMCTNGNFAGKIVVAGVVHEECFEGVAAREISKNVKPDLVIIGEASECNLKTGQRGRAEIVLETFGKSAHSASPQKGINAVYLMTDLIRRIRNIEPPISPVLGPGILELTDIKSLPYPGASVVPDYCRATYDRRLLVGETKESVLEPLNKIIEEATKANPELSAKVSYATGEELCYTGEKIYGERFFPGWAFDDDEIFVKEILEGLHDAGVDAKITHYNFCTNASHYAGEAKIPTVGFGPSMETLAHIKDEYVEVAQIEMALLGYMGILKRLFPEQ